MVDDVCVAGAATLLFFFVTAADFFFAFEADLLCALRDAAYNAFLDMVDAHIESNGMHLQADRTARAALPDPPCFVEPLQQLRTSRNHVLIRR